MMVRIIEPVDAHYKIQNVETGKVYRWCPQSVVRECTCGEQPTRTGMQKRKKVTMPDTIRGLLARRPLWIITCYHNNRMEVLTVDPDGDGGSLPVFSFEEEAKTFLGLSENDQEEGRRWRSRETTAGELVSVLLAPWAGVRQVTLDPLPLSLGMGRLMASLCSVTRERFVEELMGRRGEPAGELVLTAFKTTCPECGADHAGIAEEMVVARPEDKGDHPWRSTCSPTSLRGVPRREEVEVQSVKSMKLEDAQVGTKVRVQTDYREPQRRGSVGTIQKRYGVAGYTAFEVLFADGQTELYWDHQLEVAKEQPSLRSKLQWVFPSNW